MKLGWGYLSALAAGVVIGLALASVDLRSPAPPDRVSDTLATVGTSTITVDDFRAEMTRRGGERNFASPTAKRHLLGEMIRLEVIGTRAREEGYLEDPSVRHERMLVLAGKFRREHVEPEIAKIEVTEDDIERFYERNQEKFLAPAAVHLAMLYFAHPVTASEERRRQTLTRAKKARAYAMQQTDALDFGNLAARMSDDQASRYGGGDIGWLTDRQVETRWNARMADIVFALDHPGELSEAVATETGVYLFRLAAKRPATVRPLAEVASAIGQQLKAEKVRDRRAELYAAWTDGIAVEIDERRLAEMGRSEGPTHAGRNPPPLPQS